MAKLFQPVFRPAMEELQPYDSSTVIQDEDLIEDNNEIEQQINEAVEQLELISAVHNKLEKQAELNEDLLKSAIEKAIQDDQVRASQMALQTAMEELKYPVHEIKLHRISIEEAGDTYTALRISQESIFSLIGEVVGKTADIIVGVFSKLKKYAVNIKQYFINKERMLNDLEVLVRENEDTELTPLTFKHKATIGIRFNLILRISKGKLDINEVIDFVKAAQTNPLLDKIDEIYKYLIDPESSEDARSSVLQASLKEAKASPLHTRGLEYANSSSNLKHNGLYVLSIIQNKLTLYTDNINKALNAEDPDAPTIKKGIKIGKQTIKVDKDPMDTLEILPKFITLKDTLQLINEIRGLSRGANGYLDKLIRANQHAYDLVKDATKGLKDDAFKQSLKNFFVDGVGENIRNIVFNVWHGVSLKHPEKENAWKYVPDPTRDALNIIKDLGTSSVYDMMSNYYKNVGYLAETLNGLIKSSMAGKDGKLQPAD